MVKETSMEANTEAITASGNLRINSPDPSGRKTRGIKAMIKVAVHPITASVICFVASIAAKLFPGMSFPQPSLYIFYYYDAIINQQTKATTNPTMLNWFKEKPIAFRATIPMPRDKGIATITTCSPSTKRKQGYHIPALWQSENQCPIRLTVV